MCFFLQEQKDDSNIWGCVSFSRTDLTCKCHFLCLWIYQGCVIHGLVLLTEVTVRKCVHTCAALTFTFFFLQHYSSSCDLMMWFITEQLVDVCFSTTGLMMLLHCVVGKMLKVTLTMWITWEISCVGTSVIPFTAGLILWPFTAPLEPIDLSLTTRIVYVCS